MLKFKKIKNKEIAQVKVQADPCKYLILKGAYDCVYDCTTKNQPRYYKSKNF